MLPTMLAARARRKCRRRRLTRDLILHLSGFAKLKNYSKSLGTLLLLAVFAILLHGYHPGVEDDGVYLPAIKRHLNPQLYPHDFEFFTLQLQATVFDKLVAGSIRVTHLPIGIGVLLWHFASIFLLLWGCWRISRRCFQESYAQWAAVSTVAVLLTMPVAGTALYLGDQYLHPRLLASAAALGAIVATLDRRYWLAAGCLAIAFVIHPLMASFGISYCIFLAWKERPQSSTMLALLFPLGWIFEPTSDAWRAAAHTRDYYFLSNWHWYEWLGVFAPLILLWWFRRVATRGGSTLVADMTWRLVWYGLFQLAVALIIMLPASLERMTERLLTGGGALEPGDFLFAATDAMAQWILRTIERGEAKVWDTLTTLAHPDVFARLIEDQRREQDSAKRMKNDDVTLMRLRMLAGQPAYLLACR